MRRWSPPRYDGWPSSRHGRSPARHAAARGTALQEAEDRGEPHPGERVHGQEQVACHLQGKAEMYNVHFFLPFLLSINNVVTESAGLDGFHMKPSSGLSKNVYIYLHLVRLIPKNR